MKQYEGYTTEFQNQILRLIKFYGKYTIPESTSKTISPSNESRISEYFKVLKDVPIRLLTKAIGVAISKETSKMPSSSTILFLSGYISTEADIKSCNFETPTRKNKPCRQGFVFAWDDVAKEERQFLCPNPYCQASKQYRKTFKPYPMKQTGLYIFEDWQDMEFEALPKEKQDKINKFVAKIMKKQNGKEVIAAMVKKVVSD